MLEDEKYKRIQDLESSIDKLNITSSDKEKLRQEIEFLNKEQRDLQQKISEYEEEQDPQKTKKRKLERVMQELQIQINSNKTIGDDNQRVQYLRDQISQKEIEIRAKKRQYKEVIDMKLDVSSLSPSPVKNQLSQGNNNQLEKIQQDMKQIKELLSKDLQGGNSQETKFLEMLDDLYQPEDKENRSDDGNSSDKAFKASLYLLFVHVNLQSADESYMKDYLQKEKTALKHLKQKIDTYKNDFKNDKKSVEDQKYSDSNGYKKRTAVLDTVNESMEKTIDKFNERFRGSKKLRKDSKQFHEEVV